MNEQPDKLIPMSERQASVLLALTHHVCGYLAGPVKDIQAIRETLEGLGVEPATVTIRQQMIIDPFDEREGYDG